MQHERKDLPEHIIRSIQRAILDKNDNLARNIWAEFNITSESAALTERNDKPPKGIAIEIGAREKDVESISGVFSNVLINRSPDASEDDVLDQLAELMRIKQGIKVKVELLRMCYGLEAKYPATRSDIIKRITVRKDASVEVL